MNREPPEEVKKVLRKEVGFGCPIPGCGSPYLEWHHFDPPWNEREHHDAEGMIALCPRHHAKADGGNYPKELLHAYKQASKRAAQVKERFGFFKNPVLAVIGGNYFFEVRTPLQVFDNPVVWFNRDEEGYLLVNLNLDTISEDERVLIQDNFWIARGKLIDFSCPPNGKLIHAKYPNQDEIRVVFSIVDSADEFVKAGKNPYRIHPKISFPLTMVSISFIIKQRKLVITPGKMNINTMGFKGCSIIAPIDIRDCVGLQLGVPTDTKTRVIQIDEF